MIMRRLTAYILYVFLAVTVASGAELKEAKITTHTIHVGLGCLVAQDQIKEDLENLDIKLGSIVLVRAGSGTIPGTSPDASTNINLLLYAPKAKYGRLFFFRMEQNGRVTAIRNSYHLIRVQKGWSAGEGNGGIATYKAVSEYATELMKQSPIRVKVVPRSKDCQPEK
jgi:hypothetical protein